MVVDFTFIPRLDDLGDRLAQEFIRTGAAFKADSLTVLELLKKVTSMVPRRIYWFQKMLLVAAQCDYNWWQCMRVPLIQRCSYTSVASCLPAHTTQEQMICHLQRLFIRWIDHLPLCHRGASRS